MQGKSKLIGTFAALFVIIMAVFYMAGSFSDKQAAGLKEEDDNERKTSTIRTYCERVHRIKTISLQFHYKEFYFLPLYVLRSLVFFFL